MVHRSQENIQNPLFFLLFSFVSMFFFCSFRRSLTHLPPFVSLPFWSCLVTLPLLFLTLPWRGRVFRWFLGRVIPCFFGRVIPCFLHSAASFLAWTSLPFFLFSFPFLFFALPFILLFFYSCCFPCLPFFFSFFSPFISPFRCLSLSAFPLV